MMISEEVDFKARRVTKNKKKYFLVLFSTKKDNNCKFVYT